MKNKTVWIVVGIVLAFALLIGGLFVSSNNKAIFLEEQINAAQADINVAEKRRFDLVYNLVERRRKESGVRWQCRGVYVQYYWMRKQMYLLCLTMQ